MFDYLLFEKYGLNFNETDTAVIKQALENKKNIDGWQKDLKQTNERKRKKAEESKKQWDKDCDILLDTNKRQSYLEEFEENLMVLIEGVSEEGEEYIEIFANSVGIDSEIARKLYNQYSENSSNNDNFDVNSIARLVMQISNIQKEYLKVQDILSENEIQILAEEGVTTDNIGTVLRVENCDKLEDIISSVSNVCDIVYDLYNKQLLSPEFQKGFMEIFSKESKSENALNKVFAEPDFEKCFKINNWILFKYIKATQLMMNRKSIKESTRFPGVAESDVVSFMQALNTVFGVEIPNIKETKSQERFETKVSTKELDLGTKLLKEGKFTEAKKHFLIHSELDPYEWKSYWGMFKCELKACNDNEIYFPGFIEQLKQSDMGKAVPAYVEYYKMARNKAYIVRAAEINFDYIEMEYKQADAAQEEYNTLHNGIKFSYEHKKFDSIPSEEGRKTAVNYANVCEDYKKAFSKDADRKYGIRFFIFAIGMIVIGLSSIFSYVILENGTYETYEKILEYAMIGGFICAAIGAIVIFWKLIPIPSPLIALIKIIVLIGSTDFLGGLMYRALEDIDSTTLEGTMTIFYRFLAIGVISLLIGIAYIVRVVHWNRLEKQLLSQRDNLGLETAAAMVKDLMQLEYLPQNDYYHVVLNEDYSFDTSEYVKTFDEELALFDSI